MAKEKTPLGRYHHDVDFKDAGDVLAKAVCFQKVTQAKADAIARGLIEKARLGEVTTAEEAVNEAYRLTGVSRGFARG